MPPDQDLTTVHVRGAVAGDADSLAWLVARFTPLLLAQARYRIGPRLRGECEPEDLVQDVWAATLPALASIDLGDGRATPVVVKFVSTTLVYRVNNLLRRHIRARVRDVSTTRGAALADRLPDPTRGIVTRIVHDEQSARLMASIDELPERDREVVVLRGIEQLDNAEVANLVGDSPNAVSLRYNRALAKLRATCPGSVMDEL